MIKKQKEKNIGRKSQGSGMRRMLVLGEKSHQTWN